jgi:hypothetical protein
VRSRIGNRSKEACHENLAMAVILIGLALPATVASNPTKKKDGIIDVPSNHSVDETVE